MPFSETILLVEDAIYPPRVRTVHVTQRGVYQIIERLHVGADRVALRTWTNVADEKDLTNQLRVFREVLPDAPKEEAEHPIFDELVLKEPLQFTDDETPLGFRRKHLPKAQKVKPS